MTAAPLVVEVERSGLVESTHLVDVVAVLRDGEVIARAGEPETIAYLRSTAKPIQAAVCLDSGWQPSGEEGVAIACASHSGEPRHVEAVRAILAGASLTDQDLLCPPVRSERILHICSGKHAAMLATAAVNGWSLKDYRAEHHPLQRAVADRLARLAGAPAHRVGVDGCGVPTFAYRLDEAGRIFANLPTDAPRAVAAMRAHSFLVAGTDRLCTKVLENVPGVVIKVGAEGMFCGALIDQNLGFALKARDGAVRAAEAATLETMRVLGATVPEELAPAPVLGGGEPVGTIRIRSELSGS